MYAGARHLLENVNLTTEEESKLRELIAKSHRGLKKLQVTYIKDTSVYSQIQVLIDETKRGIFKGAIDVDTTNLDQGKTHLGFC